jgi:phage tail protein X
LSQKYYQRANTTLLDKILEINPGITNRHLILAEQKLEIPEITEASLVIPSPDGTCKVHLGTFSRPGYADSYKNEPILKGKSIEVIPRKVSPGETWYRVFASKFANRDEALSALRALKEKRILPIP